MFDLSSQRVLWESIARELLENPFGAMWRVIFRTGLRAGGIDGQTVNTGLFVQVLIARAYVQGLARALMEAQLPVRLFGKGWDEMDQFAGLHAGEVLNDEELNAAAMGSSVLVNPSIHSYAHGVEGFGRAVLNRGGFSKTQYLNEARKLLAGGAWGPGRVKDVLGVEMLTRLL